jgi:ubiquinone/menaquinone biosynthesis C-methylase UbiE
MRAKLKSLLIKLRIIPPDEQIAAHTITNHDGIDSFKVGLRDACLEGWFDASKNSLFPGINVSAQDTVLDLGCGDGGIVAFCARQGAEIILADIDADKVDAAGKRLANTPARNVRTLVTDAAPLPLESNAVTRVICTEVLEHVDNPATVLAELIRVAKPGAYFLLSVPDDSSEIVQMPVADASYYRKPNHIRIFSRDEFRSLVENAGLVVESHSMSSFYWAVWWSFFWLCGPQDFPPPKPHPLLESWARTWNLLIDMPNGPVLKRELDKQLAKVQIIVARKT